MIPTNELEIGGKDFSHRREDLSFIVRFQWKTSNHLKQAIQILLAARINESSTSVKTSTGSKPHAELDYKEFRLIRLQIASNPNTPPSVLRYLASQNDPKLLERVAENPRTGEATLELLSRCQSPAVRIAVAENINTPTNILSSLIIDPDADVRYALADNHALTAAMLTVLSEDNNPYVSSRAKSTLQKIFGDQDQKVFHYVFREFTSSSISSK